MEAAIGRVYNGGRPALVETIMGDGVVGNYTKTKYMYMLDAQVRSFVTQI